MYSDLQESYTIAKVHELEVEKHKRENNIGT